MKVCTKCLGNKKYRGMGNIMVNCDECLGVGAVSEEKVKKAEKVKNSENSEKASIPEMIAVKDPKNKSGKAKPKSPVIAKDAVDEKECKEARTA